MRAVLADYGAGNLHSVRRALEEAGASVVQQHDVRRLLEGDVLVLPGVGAYPAAMTRLADVSADLKAALRAGHPCIAICLGMQLLYESSEEGDSTARGLELVEGRVCRLTSATVPHMGWNTLEDVRDPLLADVPAAYFAHSYACSPADPATVCAWTEFEQVRFPAAVRIARTLAVQFHPEKSGTAGRRLIRAFLSEAVT